ncbi:hypothetical protein EHP00_562 [Ecytonucleospora hepatopenaei]|uniref:Uncharacterized protein n=1 Tax=Ecytonucleospora hepatopenaei TaxID=646526 RepID=A0A1W0E8E8_9MICR|nr:hypothetical protein EHP00_562 [Ecytonucleospora hepatopenaei]
MSKGNLHDISSSDFERMKRTVVEKEPTKENNWEFLDSSNNEKELLEKLKNKNTVKVEISPKTEPKKIIDCLDEMKVGDSFFMQKETNTESLSGEDVSKEKSSETQKINSVETDKQPSKYMVDVDEKKDEGCAWASSTSLDCEETFKTKEPQTFGENIIVKNDTPQRSMSQIVKDAFAEESSEDLFGEKKENDQKCVVKEENIKADKEENFKNTSEISQSKQEKEDLHKKEIKKPSEKTAENDDWFAKSISSSSENAYFSDKEKVVNLTNELQQQLKVHTDQTKNNNNQDKFKNQNIESNEQKKTPVIVHKPLSINQKSSENATKSPTSSSNATKNTERTQTTKHGWLSSYSNRVLEMELVNEKLEVFKHKFKQEIMDEFNSKFNSAEKEKAKDYAKKEYKKKVKKRIEKIVKKRFSTEDKFKEILSMFMSSEEIESLTKNGLIAIRTEKNVFKTTNEKIKKDETVNKEEVWKKEKEEKDTVPNTNKFFSPGPVTSKKMPMSSGQAMASTASNSGEQQKEKEEHESSKNEDLLINMPTLPPTKPNDDIFSSKTRINQFHNKPAQKNSPFNSVKSCTVPQNNDKPIGNRSIIQGIVNKQKVNPKTAELMRAKIAAVPKMSPANNSAPIMSAPIGESKSVLDDLDEFNFNSEKDDEPQFGKEFMEDIKDKDGKNFDIYKQDPEPRSALSSFVNYFFKKKETQEDDQQPILTRSTVYKKTQMKKPTSPPKINRKPYPDTFIKK